MMQGFSQADLVDWLRLSRTTGIGPRSFQSLLARFGDARAALEALPALARARGRSISIPDEAEIAREMARADALGARFLASCQPEYPRYLAEIEGPPPVIAIRGDANVFFRPMIGIVGARNASAAGRVMAGRLAEGLVEAGFVVVSGLARGIDTEAHRASLRHGTIAVLAGGLDKPYPPENIAMIGDITASGLLLTEMPFGWVPRGQDFPRRNRLISGLSYGVVVVEAARRSGSLITARMALEQGREVFAVPGSPLDARCEGSNDLLRNGATLIGSHEDVLDVLKPLLAREDNLFRDPRSRQATYLDEWEADDVPFAEEADDESDDRPESTVPLAQRALELMSVTPVEADMLQRNLGVSGRDLATILVELELAGAISRLPGNRYARVINR